MEMNSFPKIPGYRIIRELGAGGMAMVYLAIQEKLNREVAVKVLSPFVLINKDFITRFLKEAEMAANLSHINIIHIYDIGQVGDNNYIVMEYLKGSLKERLKKGAISLNKAIKIIKEIANALNYAHGRGFVHRDIKPENILFRSDGMAVLADFGIAKSMESSTKLTKTGISIGTPHYMSPEQARGKELDGRADLYSLGVVFCEMLTGNVPYEAEDSVAIAIKHIQEPIPELPAHFNRYQPLLDKMMAKDRKERVQSGAELVRLIAMLEKEGRNIESVPPVVEKRRERVEKSSKSQKMQAESKEGMKENAPAKPKAKRSSNKLLLVSLAALLVVTVGLLWVLISQNAVNRDDEAFARAVRGNTKSFYEAYLRSYPSGRHENEARQRIFAENEREWEARDNETFQKAKKEDTERAYEHYLSSYPNGRHASEARQRIEELKEHQPGQIWLEPVTGIEFVWIPAGEFQMGSESGDSDEKPVHRVYVDGFWIGKYEVTQVQWKKIMSSNPSHFKSGDNCPVEEVSWNDAQEFIRKLNNKTGENFRLLTEAEWEYACRAGTTGERYGNLDDIAWYGGNSGDRTHSVGQKLPNAWGLYDMLGNVWEWCQDLKGDYSSDYVRNPKGPSSGSCRVHRGGSWYSYTGLVRSAYRGGYDPGYDSYIRSGGFRLAKTK